MPSTPPSEGRFAHLPYRRSVGIMLLNRRDEVFVGRRIDTTTEAWQMPQGGIDGDEEPRSAALREMKEEIGTDHAEILAESAHWLNYDLPAHLVPRVWGGRYRGQTQKWFALRFLGRDSDIDIATEHAEFMAWRWMRPEEMLTAIVPFKHAVYVSVLDEFADLLRPHAR
jgi:putative (di)nucleoside polyphosphate hydrolase